MKLGLADAHMNCLSVEGDHAKRYQQLVETSVEGEKLGYWSMYLTEHHFGSDRSYRPQGVPDDYVSIDSDISVDPLTLHHYLAAKTTNLRLGTSVTGTRWDHPMRIAERAAMLDCLSGGRLELGLGRGDGFREDVAFNVPLDKDADTRRYLECLEIIIGSWSGELFSYEGEFYTIPQVYRVPRPVQKKPPFWIAAISPEIVEFAGSHGLPYQSVAWGTYDPAKHQARRARWLAAAEEAGHDVSDLLLPVVLFMYCGESDQEAAEVTEEYMTVYRNAVEQHYERARRDYAHPDRPIVDDAARAGDPRFAGTAGAQATGVLSDALVQGPIEHHIIGSPETCLERIRSGESDLGFNYIGCMVSWGMMPQEKNLASLRRLAEHVMPRIELDHARAGRV